MTALNALTRYIKVNKSRKIEEEQKIEEEENIKVKGKPESKKAEEKKEKEKEKSANNKSASKIAKDQPRSRRILIQNKSEDAWTICHKQKRYTPLRPQTKYRQSADISTIYRGASMDDARRNFRDAKPFVVPYFQKLQSDRQSQRAKTRRTNDKGPGHCS